MVLMLIVPINNIAIRKIISNLYFVIFILTLQVAHPNQDQEQHHAHYHAADILFSH